MPRKPFLSATQEADYTKPIGRMKGVIGIVAEQLLAVEPVCGAIREKPDPGTFFLPFTGDVANGNSCQELTFSGLPNQHRKMTRNGSEAAVTGLTRTEVRSFIAGKYEPSRAGTDSNRMVKP